MRIAAVPAVFRHADLVNRGIARERRDGSGHWKPPFARTSTISQAFEDGTPQRNTRDHSIKQRLARDDNSRLPPRHNARFGSTAAVDGEVVLPPLNRSVRGSIPTPNLRCGNPEDQSAVRQGDPATVGRDDAADADENISG